MDKEHLEREFKTEFVSARDNWKAVCPFHDERTPSFLVHKDELIANCFGCGTHGYIDTLLSRYAGVSLKEARERLDIDLIDDVVLKKRHPEQEGRLAPKVFPESWLAPFKKEIHKQILEKVGYDDEAIGLLKSAGTRFDPALKRQVFPYRNERGDLIGATGRTCAAELPKWYMYWSSRRGHALHRPWTGGTRADVAIVGEGTIDAIRGHRATNGRSVEGSSVECVATLGAKFGAGQFRELKGYRHVVLAFDSDEAGQKAAYRMWKKLNKSVRVSFVEWPEGHKDGDKLSYETLGDVLMNWYTYLEYVQRSALFRAEASGGVPMQQKKGAPRLGAGFR